MYSIVIPRQIATKPFSSPNALITSIVWSLYFNFRSVLITALCAYPFNVDWCLQNTNIVFFTFLSFVILFIIYFALCQHVVQRFFFFLFILVFRPLLFYRHEIHRSLELTLEQILATMPKRQHIKIYYLQDNFSLIKKIFYQSIFQLRLYIYSREKQLFFGCVLISPSIKNVI